MHPILFQATDWAGIPITQCAGERGTAIYKTLQYETFRVRMVEYSKGYKADHWCSKGHIVYCIEGEVTCELKDGRNFTLTPGMVYTVSDDASIHRSATELGVKLMIIDGNFLRPNIKSKGVFNPWKI